MTAPRFAPSAAPPAPGFAPRVAPPRRPRRVLAPAAPPAPPVLRLVDRTAERRRRLTRAITGALIVAVCAGLFAIVGLRVLLAQGQVEIDRLQARVDTGQTTQQRLHLTVAELEAPTHIVDVARTRLGMINPTSVITLSSPSPPAPAP